MHTIDAFYIDGEWIAPAQGEAVFQMIDPVTEKVAGSVAMGAQADVDRAVAAARAALPAWAATTVEERVGVLKRVAQGYAAHLDEMAVAIRAEIGAPRWLCEEYQARIGLAQLQSVLDALPTFAFSERRGTTEILREPVGVVALITPWNWPINQIVAKVAPALAAGCTIVLKPSELAPLDARLFAQIMHEAGVPRGVFNMLYGDGASVGAALSGHPGVDMVSITGSTRAGIEVAINAARSVKRVAQELGGKSANVILDDADIKSAVSAGVVSCMLNTGQTCIAPTRMLVPRSRYAEAVEIARATASALKVGDPADPATKLGPLSNVMQYEKVQRMIDTGIAEGARVVAGGPGRPEHLAVGFFARPTVFADVRNDMTIAQEEIFGPVLCMIPYDTEEDAVAIANDTPYGLAAYVWSADPARARRVAGGLRAGCVQINGAKMDFSAPFGGAGASGNGREHGAYGIAEFLDYKSVMGCGA